MILISYDGSPDARAAIDHAARLMPGAPTTVLTVWEPFIDVMTRTGSAGFGMGMPGTVDIEKIDSGTREAAQATAAEGAELARAAGLVAAGSCVVRHMGVGHSVIEAAADVDADVIVVGTRGLGGVKSVLLGSVSHALVQHSDVPVLVVPSPDFAEARREAVQVSTAVA
jgi:nucleotide-binding universal stress UspA family protein